MTAAALSNLHLEAKIAQRESEVKRPLPPNLIVTLSSGANAKEMVLTVAILDATPVGIVSVQTDLGGLRSWAATRGFVRSQL
jgi:hypothetical protein